MSEDEDYGSASDSDAVLQELYASGKIKPGINIPVEKAAFINDTSTLEDKIGKIELNLPWVETAHVICDLAPLAPELSVEIIENDDAAKSSKYDSIALNEFKRETLFHRQAQAAITEGLNRLHSLGVPTLRPDDNFAEMMKSDDHMQKVRKSLLNKQAGLERSEKVKKIRMEKKLAKQKQIESTLRKQKEKKKLSEEIKKYRKGVRKDLNFLEPDTKKQTDSNKAIRINKNRQVKNQKYGYGGKKRGTKNSQFDKGNKHTKKTRAGKNRRQRNKNRN